MVVNTCDGTVLNITCRLIKVITRTLPAVLRALRAPLPLYTSLREINRYFVVVVLLKPAAILLKAAIVQLQSILLIGARIIEIVR